MWSGAVRCGAAWRGTARAGATRFGATLALALLALTASGRASTGWLPTRLSRCPLVLGVAVLPCAFSSDPLVRVVRVVFDSRTAGVDPVSFLPDPFVAVAVAFVVAVVAVAFVAVVTLHHRSAGRRGGPRTVADGPRFRRPRTPGPDRAGRPTPH